MPADATTRRCRPSICSRRAAGPAARAPVASDWARSEAGDAWAPSPRARRPNARAARGRRTTWPVPSWSCRPPASAPGREDTERARRLPVQGPRLFRRRTTPMSSSAASGSWPRWSRASLARRCSAIVGPSGSGKSSALRAGLLPRSPTASSRQRGWAPACCVRASTRCARSSRRPPGRVRGRLIVAVDQFEEMFTACHDEAERAAFVDALVGRARDPSRRALVLVAVRADFYGRCAAYPELSRPARRQPRPGRTDAPRRAAPRDRAAGAPRRPAGRARARRRAGRRRRGRARRAAAAVDGAAGALAAARRPAAAPERLRARRRRARRGRAPRRGAPTRGSTPSSETSRGGSCCGSPARARATRSCGGESSSPSSTPSATRRRRGLDVLADERLVTIDEGDVEVAHEALLREWPRLRGWLDEDAEGRRLHLHLARAAREWDADGRDPGELYRGARLASALDWSAAHEHRAQRDRARLPRRAAARRATARTAPTSRAGGRRRAAGARGASPASSRSSSVAPRATRRARPTPSGSAPRRSPRTTSTVAAARRQGVALDDSAADARQPARGADREPGRDGVLRGEGEPFTTLALSPEGACWRPVPSDNVFLFDTRTRRRVTPAQVVPGRVRERGHSAPMATGSRSPMTPRRSPRQLVRPRCPHSPRRWRAYRLRAGDQRAGYSPDGVTSSSHGPGLVTADRDSVRFDARGPGSGSSARSSHPRGASPLMAPTTAAACVTLGDGETACATARPERP